MGDTERTEAPPHDTGPAPPDRENEHENQPVAGPCEALSISSEPGRSRVREQRADVPRYALPAVLALPTPRPARADTPCPDEQLPPPPRANFDEVPVEAPVNGHETPATEEPPIFKPEPRPEPELEPEPETPEETAALPEEAPPQPAEPVTESIPVESISAEAAPAPDEEVFQEPIAAEEANDGQEASIVEKVLLIPSAPPRAVPPSPQPAMRPPVEPPTPRPPPRQVAAAPPPPAEWSFEPRLATPAASHPGSATAEAPSLRLPSVGWQGIVRTALRYAAYAFVAWLTFVLALIVIYRFVDPPFSNLMLAERLGGGSVRQVWVPINRVSGHLIRAVVMSEDSRFCRHWGVDLRELGDAIERARDGVPRGASTITMQVTKNLFLWSAKSYVRKAIELPLTFVIELVWPKRRILEVYLNIAEWGPGIYGAEAAARHHFGKSVNRLNEREAALMAVALPNPLLRDARSPGPGTQRLATRIQLRMRAAGGAVNCI